MFIGTTGCGKTTLVREIAKFRDVVVVLDTKGFIDWDGYELHKDFASLIKSKALKLIFRPDGKWLRDDDAIELFFRWIYERENTTIYIDEATSITSAYKIPQGYFDCIVRGREKNVEVWTSTQRPKKIAQEILTESENCYCFQIRNENDMKVLIDMYGIDSETLKKMPEHYFIYSRNGELTAPNILELKKKGK